MEKTKEKTVDKSKKKDKLSIIVYNDDVNTFDWVIESFISVCGHDYIQAEQCAMIIHNNGKCDVMTGSYDYLKPYCLELLNRQLSAKIE